MRALVLLLAALAGLPPFAQNSPAQDQPAQPSLHRRTAAQPDAAPTAATGHTDLPPAAEGEYPWNKLGGVITLYFEGGKLQGYMTDPLDPNPNAAAPTLNLATTHADGHAIEWTTEQVHGRSFSFRGRLERGAAGSPTLPGYYLLTGTLTQRGGQAGDAVRTVSLKRAPATP